MKRDDGSSTERIYRVVRRIPEGRVATYGQVASLAGLYGQARRIGHAMAALPPDSDVPWQRVVNARGQVSHRAEPDGEVVQRLLLEAEGIVFDAHGRIDLGRRRWEPESEEAPRPASRTSDESRPGTPGKQGSGFVF